VQQYNNGSIAELIGFNMHEVFTPSSKPEYLTLTLITSGKINLTINEKKAMLISPCILLSSWHSKLELHAGNQYTAKSLCFHPTLVNKNLTYESLIKNDFTEFADMHDCSLLAPFLARDDCADGIVRPTSQTYRRISELFELAGKEEKIKSGRHWLYRVRRYLIQILFLLEDTYQNTTNTLSNESIIDAALEYIHANYPGDISLDSICRHVYVNRTSLTRKFKEYTRRTPIDYLLHYRLNIACELLSNSKLSINKIAETTGFKYESYFSRQFTAKIGLTPTQYRLSDGFEILNSKESYIVDEF